VILAIGQACDFDTCDLAGNVRVAGNLIAINKDTQETEVPGVFAGGDAANGPGAVVDAVAAGRRAAVSIDKYLGGDGVVVSDYATLSLDVYDPQREMGFAELKREHFTHLPLDQRHQGFAEVDQCFSADQAKKEAHRCFQCDYEVCMARAARVTAAFAK
jgi:NADH-quinone oxidoreductase subunit F